MMKFAFSAAGCVQWDVLALTDHARQWGYDGVELCPGSGTAGDPALTDPRKVREIFESAGVGVACLACDVKLSQDKKADSAATDTVRRWIDLAAELNCPLVKVQDTLVKPRQSRTEAAMALGDWLAGLGEIAGLRGIRLVVENAISFRTAREMWTILERLDHSSVGAAWDIANAAAAGESPWTSVPTLNSRIFYAIVRDVRPGPQGEEGCPLGEGKMEIQSFMDRLRGIGYRGWVTIKSPDESLAGAISILRPPAETAPPADAAKPAAAKH